MKSSIAWLPVLFCMVQAPCFAQFDRKASQDSLRQKSDYDKVIFINKNHYVLYSVDFENAYALLAEASRLGEKNGWKQEEAFSNMYWGVVTYLMGRYNEVQPKYFKALELFEQLDNQSGIAAVHNELAVFYRRQKDTLNHNRSLDIAEENARNAGDLERLGTTLGHRGYYQLNRGKYAEAQSLLEEVYKIRIQLQDSVGLGYALMDLAELATRQKKFEASINYLNQAIALRKKLNDRNGVAVSTTLLGETYAVSNQHAESITWLSAGLVLARQVQYPELVKQTLGSLANEYNKIGDSKKAFLLKEEQYALQDSLLNIEKAKAIQEMQAKYETEKKELLLAEQKILLARNQWLIILLTLTVVLLLLLVIVWRRNTRAREKQLIAEKQQEFQSLLIESVIALQENERARVAKDLHDGFGQYISTVQLYVSQSTDAWKQKASDLLHQMHTEVRNIAFDLLPHTLASSGLVPALKELALRITNSNKIRVDLHANEVERMSNKLEVSLYRICQEWINNILKYNNATVININIVQHDGELSLVIEDNGEGFDARALEQSSGNGWRNMQSRVQLYKGNIFVDTVPNRIGNTLVVEIPLVAELQQVA